MYDACYVGYNCYLWNASRMLCYDTIIICRKHAVCFLVLQLLFVDVSYVVLQQYHVKCMLCVICCASTIIFFKLCCMLCCVSTGICGTHIVCHVVLQILFVDGLLYVVLL